VYHLGMSVQDIPRVAVMPYVSSIVLMLQVLFPDGAGRTVSPEGVETDVTPERLCAAVRAPPPTDVPAIVL